MGGAISLGVEGWSWETQPWGNQQQGDELADFFLLVLDAMEQGGDDQVLTQPSSVALQESPVHDDNMAPHLVSLVTSYHCHWFGGGIHDHCCHGDVEFGGGGGGGGDGHGHQ